MTKKFGANYCRCLCFSTTNIFLFIFDCRGTFEMFDFESTSDEETASTGILRTGKKREKYKKKVRYFDLLPGDIMLPTPVPVVKHSTSNESILNVSIYYYCTVGTSLSHRLKSGSRPPTLSPDTSQIWISVPFSLVLLKFDKYITKFVIFKQKLPIFLSVLGRNGP